MPFNDVILMTFVSFDITTDKNTYMYSGFLDGIDTVLLYENRNFLIVESVLHVQTLDVCVYITAFQILEMLGIRRQF